MTKVHCENCRFWEPWQSGENRGDCRLFPPTIHRRVDPLGEVVWDKSLPDTAHDEWCGQGEEAAHA